MVVRVVSEKQRLRGSKSRASRGTPRLRGRARKTSHERSRAWPTTHECNSSAVHGHRGSVSRKKKRTVDERGGVARRQRRVVAIKRHNNLRRLLRPEPVGQRPERLAPRPCERDLSRGAPHQPRAVGIRRRNEKREARGLKQLQLPELRERHGQAFRGDVSVLRLRGCGHGLQLRGQRVQNVPRRRTVLLRHSLEDRGALGGEDGPGVGHAWRED